MRKQESKNWVVHVYAADEVTLVDSWYLRDRTQDEASKEADEDIRTRGHEWTLVELPN